MSDDLYAVRESSTLRRPEQNSVEDLGAQKNSSYPRHSQNSRRITPTRPAYLTSLNNNQHQRATYAVGRSYVNYNGVEYIPEAYQQKLDADMREQGYERDDNYGGAVAYRKGGRTNGTAPYWAEARVSHIQEISRGGSNQAVVSGSQSVARGNQSVASGSHNQHQRATHAVGRSYVNYNGVEYTPEAYQQKLDADMREQGYERDDNYGGAVAYRKGGRTNDTAPYGAEARVNHIQEISRGGSNQAVANDSQSVASRRQSVVRGNQAVASGNQSVASSSHLHQSARTSDTRSDHSTPIAYEPCDTIQKLNRAAAYWTGEVAENPTTAHWWLDEPLDDNRRNVLDTVTKFLNQLAKPACNIEGENLRERVATVLAATDRDSTLRDGFLAAIIEGSTSCVDRTIYLFNMIEGLCEIHRVLNEAKRPGAIPSDELMLRKIRGLIRQQNLDKLADDFIAKSRADRTTSHFIDEVEIRLAYRIALRELLELPVKTTQMHYGSGVRDVDIQEAVSTLLTAELDDPQTLCDAINNHPYWKQYLEKQYKEEHDLDAKLKSFHDKMEKLEADTDARKTLVNTIARKQPGNDSYADSELVKIDIAYAISCNELSKERKQLSEQWYQEKSQVLIATHLGLLTK